MAADVHVYEFSVLAAGAHHLLDGRFAGDRRGAVLSLFGRNPGELHRDALGDLPGERDRLTPDQDL
jgi:hypothetical protein